MALRLPLSRRVEAPVISRSTLSFIVILMLPALAVAQPAPETLSLDAAIKLAVDSNRALEASRLQVAKAQEDLAVARTRRLPNFETSVQASQLLTPVDFSFPAGSFGDIPGVGPIPAVDTAVSSPTRPSFYVSSQVSQPLTQLVRIGLGIRNASTSIEIEKEHVRENQRSLVNNVKRLYFAILQTESALTATDEAISLYKELDRTLTVRVAQKVALKSDSLDVQLRLAQEEVTRMSYANTLASQKEQFNQLLGRDVRTAFDVTDVAPVSASEIDVEAAQKRALADRPDVREARLKVTQADLDRRSKKAERIPDVSLAVSYLSNFNIDVLPQNMAAVGVQVKWEPFDWGRKRSEFTAKSHTVEQARLNVREIEDKAVLEINSRYRTLTEARAMLHVARLGQDSAREKLRVKTNQYQIQAALLSDVLGLRAELASSTDRYQQSLLAFWTAKADFEHAVGEDGLR